MIGAQSVKYMEQKLKLLEDFSNIFPQQCAQPEPCASVDGIIDELAGDVAGGIETHEGALRRATESAEEIRRCCTLGQLKCPGKTICRLGLR